MQMRKQDDVYVFWLDPRLLQTLEVRGVQLVKDRAERSVLVIAAGRVHKNDASADADYPGVNTEDKALLGAVEVIAG